MATPDSDAAAPIGPGDLVQVDLTFLDDLSPGDVLSTDVAFLQAFMGAAPSGLGPVELLASRLEAGRVQRVSHLGDGTPGWVAGWGAGGAACRWGRRAQGQRTGRASIRADTPC